MSDTTRAGVAGTVGLAAVVDEGLGNSCYLVDLGDGAALVVDPPRDLRGVRVAVAEAGVRIRFVADTHLHADFLSAAVQLAHDDGATVLASAAGSRDFEHRGLGDGDEVDLGGLTLTALEVRRLDPVRAAALPYAGDLADREALAEPMVERAAPTVVVCGHLHVREGIAEGSLLQLACCALVEPPFEATVLALDAAGGRALSVSRFAHELRGGTELRRDPRLTSAEETWQFSPLRGWRRSRPGSRGPHAPRRAP